LGKTTEGNQVRETYLLTMLLALSPMSFSDPLALAINEDNSHFFGSRTADDMTLPGLYAFVDQYAGTKVSHLFLCPNAMRASYDSAVWDAIWELGNQKAPAEGTHGAIWRRNAELLAERGLDPYAVWIARCREQRVSPWLSMRMNDIHDVDDETNFMHNTFWLQHPEYRRVPERPTSWQDKAYNFAIPEVREHHMKLIRELLERYDADGLELDWMRFGYHFKPGEEAAGCEILTQFMREVRALTRQWSETRGHAVKLGARVPTHPDAATGLGMDGVRWVREGLIDMLVPTPFWATGDFDIPIELWRERLGDAASTIVLAAGHEVLLRAYPGAEAVPNDLESVRGFAAASLHRGADQIYLFNYMDPAPMQGGPETYRQLIEEGLALNVVTARPRRHVVTYRDTVPAGVSNNTQLPAAMHQNPTFHIYTGPTPEKASVVFLVGLADGEGVADATFSAMLNGKACTAIEDAADVSAFPGVTRAVQFRCPLEAMAEGYNDFAVAQAADQREQRTVWAHVRIDPTR